mmetsp:Transcript_39603/g.48046  ORF Transcript_39603/g.48046 Transcript_39603/m.48046 type:complete len:91 (-) Transcript_39603:1622-1894(-)
MNSNHSFYDLIINFCIHDLVCHPWLISVSLMHSSRVPTQLQGSYIAPGFLHSSWLAHHMTRSRHHTAIKWQTARAASPHGACCTWPDAQL